MADKYYAIRKGKKTGIYRSWNECKEYIIGYKKAEYKSFLTEEEALNYLNNFEEIEEKTKDNIDGTEVIAYVDGSYNVTTNSYGYGIVLINSLGEEIEIVGSFIDNSLSNFRNVAGELMATKEAVRKAIELKYKHIYISYDYVGIKHWAKNEWKTNNKLTLDYKNYMQEKAKDIEIDFIKIDAHSGNKYNDRADFLAKKSSGIL